MSKVTRRRHSALRPTPPPIKFQAIFAVVVIQATIILSTALLSWFTFLAFLVPILGVFVLGSCLYNTYAINARNMRRAELRAVDPMHIWDMEEELGIAHWAGDSDPKVPPPAQTGSPFTLDRSLIGSGESEYPSQPNPFRGFVDVSGDDLFTLSRSKNPIVRFVEDCFAALTLMLDETVTELAKGQMRATVPPPPPPSSVDAEALSARMPPRMAPAEWRAALLANMAGTSVAREDMAIRLTQTFEPSPDCDNFIGHSDPDAKCPRCQSARWDAVLRQGSETSNTVNLGMSCLNCGLCLPYRRVVPPVLDSDLRHSSGLRPGRDRVIMKGGRGLPPPGPDSPWRKSGSDSCVWRHRWNKVEDTGGHLYYECRKCHKRKVVQTGGGHQPIDRQWLAGGEWFNPTRVGGMFQPMVDSVDEQRRAIDELHQKISRLEEKLSSAPTTQLPPPPGFWRSILTKGYGGQPLSPSQAELFRHMLDLEQEAERTAAAELRPLFELDAGQPVILPEHIHAVYIPGGKVHLQLRNGRKLYADEASYAGGHLFLKVRVHGEIETLPARYSEVNPYPPDPAFDEYREE